LLASGILCVICYGITVFAGNPVVSLIGCAACGLSVCLMWPGTLSLTSECFPKGGAAMFGMLALFGDLGCSIGPWASGLVADRSGLKTGLMAGMAFPVLFIIGAVIMKNKELRMKN
ncbi:MAG: MFS transporter, partial [Oscillospiraceae bacterium]|nr:MFS transporter [Oscillospiraceae bacterium]